MTSTWESWSLTTKKKGPRLTSRPHYTVTPACPPRTVRVGCAPGLRPTCGTRMRATALASTPLRSGRLFAMANYIADETGKRRWVSALRLPDLRISLPRTFASVLPPLTATMAAAWHGLSTSWARRSHAWRVPPFCFDNIAAEGATRTTEEVNYDECVAHGGC